MPGAQGIRAGRAFVELGVSNKLTQGLKRAHRQLKQFGANVREIGQGILKASAAAAAPLAVSSVVFARFEQNMARVRALTGATGKDFDKLSNKAKELGSTTVFSASQAAEAMAFFAMAGFDTAQILKAIGPTLNLAAAGQIEIAQAADIAAKIMAGMGMKADQLGDVVDVLAKAATTANTDMQMLGDAMKYAASIANTAGISFEEITAAIQLLGSGAGIQADMAGTSLRGTISKLTSPSKEAASKLKELGVAVNDANGNVRPLADIIEDLSRAMDGLGSGQRLNALGQIFGDRQLAAVTVLLSQGADELRRLTAELHGAGGTASRIASVQLNTLTGTVTILKSALEGLAIAIGDALVGPLRVAVHAITQVTGVITEWVSKNREIIVMAALGAVAVGAIGAALVALGVAAQVAAFVVGGLVSIIAAMKAVFAAAVAAVGAMLSPIGLVITAVVGLGAAIAIHTGAAGDALEWLRSQFGRLSGFVGKVTEGISNALAAGDISMAARVLWLSLKLVWQQGVASLSSVWLGAKRFFISTAQKMWYGALAVAQYVFHGLEVAWIEVTSFMSQTWTNLVADLKQVWGLVQNWLTKRWLDLFGLFGSLTDEQVELAKRMSDQEFGEEAGKTEEARDKAVAEREQRRVNERDSAKQIHDATLAEIGRQFEEAQDKLNADTNAKAAETQQKLNEAIKAWKDALADAKQRRADAGKEKAPPGKPKMPGNLSEQIDGLAGSIADRISVTGTFNPAALRGLGGSNAAERTARATEAIEKNTKRLPEMRGLVLGM